MAFRIFSNQFTIFNSNPECKSIYYENCFSILDSTRTKYTLKLRKVCIKIVKALPKQASKMYFALDSCIEKTIQYFSISSNI